LPGGGTASVKVLGRERPVVVSAVGQMNLLASAARLSTLPASADMASERESTVLFQVCLSGFHAVCHGVGRDINVQCVLIKEMIIIVDHYTLAVRNRR
jgi:hypothetical protein